MLGVILYVTLLLINAMAILSEDRFLARSPCCCSRLTFEILMSSSSRLVIHTTCKHERCLSPAIRSDRLRCRAARCRRESPTDKSYWCSSDSHAKCVMYSAGCSVRFISQFGSSVPLIGLNLVVIIYEVLLG